MFTPMAGPAAGLSFIETFLSCLIGAYFSVTLFYFTSNYFMIQAQKRFSRRKELAIKRGKLHKIKKTFTKSNRRVIKFKLIFSRWMTCWLFPLFLSLPLGTIITAKFYKHQKNTFGLILLGVTLNCFIITGGTYFVHAIVI